MSNKTISINYNIVETDAVTRNSVFEDMIGIMTTNGYSYKESSIAPTSSIVLGPTVSLLYIRVDNPVSLTINGTTVIGTIDSIFLSSLQSSGATITNSSTSTSVNAIFLYF